MLKDLESIILRAQELAHYKKQNDFKNLEWDQVLLKLSPADPAPALGVGRGGCGAAPCDAGPFSDRKSLTCRWQLSPRPQGGVGARSPRQMDFSHSWLKLSRAQAKARSDRGAATCVLLSLVWRGLGRTRPPPIQKHL